MLEVPPGVANVSVASLVGLAGLGPSDYADHDEGAKYTFTSIQVRSSMFTLGLGRLVIVCVCGQSSSGFCKECPALRLTPSTSEIPTAN